MDTTESRDAYEIFTERHRAGSMIVSSNRGPDEWLGTFADPVRAQSAIDRFTGNAYDFVIDGESYRPRQKPKLGATLVNDAQNGLRTNDRDPGRDRETPNSAHRRRLGGRRRQPRLAGHGAGR